MGQTLYWLAGNSEREEGMGETLHGGMGKTLHGGGGKWERLERGGGGKRRKLGIGGYKF